MITEHPRFIGRPVYSLQTMLREISQYNQHILPVIPSGKYGPNTYASVISFQETFSLPVNGVVNYETWQSITEQFESLAPITSPDLYLAQAMFTALAKQYSSFKPSNINGHLNTVDQENIRRLQMIAGLPETGMLNSNTYLVLQELYALTKNKSSS